LLQPLRPTCLFPERSLHTVHRLCHVRCTHRSKRSTALSLSIRLSLPLSACSPRPTVRVSRVLPSGILVARRFAQENYILTRFVAPKTCSRERALVRPRERHSVAHVAFAAQHSVTPHVTSLHTPVTTTSFQLSKCCQTQRIQLDNHSKGIAIEASHVVTLARARTAAQRRCAARQWRRRHRRRRGRRRLLWLRMRHRDTNTVLPLIISHSSLCSAIRADHQNSNKPHPSPSPFRLTTTTHRTRSLCP
jgi:hypothetical protein